MRGQTCVRLVILAFGLLAGNLGTRRGLERTSRDLEVSSGRPPVRWVTSELKQEGAKLTGKVTLPGGMSQEIQDGKVTGEVISFFIQPRANGPKVYHTGEVVGDTIKGVTEFEPPGGPRRPHFDWQAERVVD